MLKKYDLYQIDTGYACFGIEVNKNIVVNAAPIGHWMIGKTVDQIRKWARIRSIVQVTEYK